MPLADFWASAPFELTPSGCTAPKVICPDLRCPEVMFDALVVGLMGYFALFLALVGGVNR